MNKILVGRAINGITINGLEYLLSEDGAEPLRFNDVHEAELFLKDHGLTDEDIECLRFVPEIADEIVGS